MRVRVTFRYRADTGEVEVFTVDAIDGDASDADHDLLHDRATASVARVVERHPDIQEVRPGDPAEAEQAPPDPPGGPPRAGQDEEGPRKSPLSRGEISRG
jgi:hypothetical protein